MVWGLVQVRPPTVVELAVTVYIVLTVGDATRTSPEMLPGSHRYCSAPLALSATEPLRQMAVSDVVVNVGLNTVTSTVCVFIQVVIVFVPLTV